jgi:hypothetical protein
MTKKILTGFILVAALFVANPLLKGFVTEKTFSDMVETSIRPLGSPKYSDVCFSSRWKRPVDGNDSHDTLRDAANFYATRLDWVYSTDMQWISGLKKLGYHYGGALNSILPDSPSTMLREKGRIENEQGYLITAPWMRAWKGVWWGCVNSPEYRKSFLDHAKLMIDAGADVLHVDDPGMNYRAVDWGGCYCQYCREKARKHGVELRRDMSAFQKSSVDEFYREMRTEIDRYAKRHVSFSSNNFGGSERWSFPYDIFEYAIGECDAPTPKAFIAMMQASRRLGKMQVLTLRSDDVGLYRRTISLAYATGLQILVPYDVNLRSTHGGSPRYFGKPEEYADLFGFVRANTKYLDSYEDAAYFGKDLNDMRLGNPKPISIQGGSGNTYAFVRSQKGQPDAPIVVHLVEWGQRGMPFALLLRKTSLWGNGGVNVKLLVPAKYNLLTHAQAEKDRDYSRLTEITPLTLRSNKDFWLVDVPPLNPWGILVLVPAST